MALLLLIGSTAAACDGDDTADRETDEKPDTETGFDGGVDDAGETAASSDEDDTDPTAEEAYIESIEEKMAAASIPGITVAIAVGEEVVWRRGFGYADVEAEQSATPDTPFHIASISKTFIGTALMQLEESGAIDIDDNINQFGLPFTVAHPDFEEESIPLRYLTNHTSGIIDNDEIYMCNYYLEDNHSSLIDLLYPGMCDPLPTIELGAFLESYLTPEGALYDEDANFTPEEEGPPGTFFSYSNIAAGLAAYAIGTATGTPFDEHCEENIFAPLRMENTHWHYSDFDDESLPPATLYYVVEGERIPLPQYSILTWPDGGLKASANDLARYLAAIMNGGILADTRILSEEKVQEMLASQTDDINQTGTLEFLDFYGTFWFGVEGLVGHTGGDPGVSTTMVFSPEDKVGIVILINMDAEFIEDVEGEIVFETLQLAYTF